MCHIYFKNGVHFQAYSKWEYLWYYTELQEEERIARESKEADEKTMSKKPGKSHGLVKFSYHWVTSVGHNVNIWPKYLFTNCTDSNNIVPAIELILRQIFPYWRLHSDFQGANSCWWNTGGGKNVGLSEHFKIVRSFNCVSKIWISWHVSKIDFNLTFLQERKNINQKVPSFPDVSFLYLSLLPLTFAKKETTVTRCDITCHFTDIWKV